MQYNKPFKSIQEQIQILHDRGLLTDSDTRHYLSHINYYRLSGYWIPFQQDHSTHSFKANTHFDDVLTLYIFDRELRLLLLNAIERIEVSLRTHWAYYCAELFGSHAYTDDTLSKNSQWHNKNLNLLNNEIKRSHEVFIKHYCEKYTHPKYPPIWVVCEVMSLGLLSRWLKDLKPTKICNKIAKSYQVDYSVLTSFTEHMAYIRHLCAHHSRIWNRKVTKTTQIPISKPIYLIGSFNQDPSAIRKIYNSLVMLIHFLNIISPNNHLKTNLISLIEKHSIDVISMGFPLKWKQQNIWKN